MTQSTAISQPAPGLLRRVFRSAWQAFSLQEEAYSPLVESPHPFKEGFIIVSLVFLVVALATSLGLVLDILTLPRVQLIQEQLYQVITHLTLYQNMVAQRPLNGTIFGWLYNLAWFLVRLWGNYPNPPYVIISFFSTIFFGLANWITYAFLAQIVARWLGGTARKGVFYGTMALAFAPKLLLVLNVIPGLSVPASLVNAWILATSYQAIRATYKLPWGRSLAILILTYVLNIVLIILALVFGVLIGVLVSKMMQGS